MLNNLTPEQEELMIKVKNRWLDLVFTDKGCNEDEARKGVKWLYSMANLKEPIIIVLQSPLGCQYAANMLIDALKGSQVGSQVESQVRSQVWSRVESQVRSQVGSQVWSQVRSEKLEFFPTADCDLFWDAGWVSFYDYFKSIGILSHEALDKYIEYLSAGGVVYSIFLEGVAIVCGRPETMTRDEELRLHCADGPAVSWADGYKQYFWHGTTVPEKLIERPDEITKEDLVKEQNAEVRRCMKEKLGTDKFFGLLDVTEVNRQEMGVEGYRREVVLYRSKERDDLAGDYLQFVKVICHSTGREFVLCVPSDIKDAREAVAWSFGKSVEEYAPVVEA